jgi:hypothetical protein
MALKPISAPKLTATPITGPVAQPDAQINSIFSPHIGSRASASNPGVLEYYNKQTGQGFSNAQDLYSFASTLGAGVIGSFDQLHAPVNGSFNTQVQSYAPADNNQTIAQNAGNAGLTPDEFIKLIQNQNGLTPEEQQSIYDRLGIPALAEQAYTPPKQNTVDFYNQLYGSSGLADVKQRILDLNKQIAQRQQNFLDAQGTINENPFLSEASRVGRVSRLTDKANAEIHNLINEQTQYQSVYQNGLGEINNVVTAHGTDVSNTQTLNANHLTYLLGQAEKQATAQQNKDNQAAYTYLPDYLKAKAKAQSPATVTSPSGATFYYDKNTGTFQQLTPASVNADTNPITGELYSKNTGQALGNASGSFGGYAAGTAPRLANNNNPTAFSTDVARDMGLIEGVDYVRGDKFPGASTLYTAKLLGDPIATTIKGIDNSGFYTSSGKPRWSYLNELPPEAVKNWQSLSYDQKAAVVQQMFIREGGKGDLLQGGGVIDNLVQQVIANPQVFQTLSANQQQAVTARMAQKGIQIPANLAKPSDTQNQASTYATRVKQSGDVLDNLTGSITSYNPVGFKAEIKLPSYLQSSQIKQYQQAGRNLINAILRRESGAAISSGEFENAYAQYLPVPGDDDKTVAQKKQNREAILNGLIQSAGPAGSNNGLTMPGGFSGSDPLGLGI